MEHSRGQRHPTDVTVRIFTRPATIGVGRVLNVSSTGAFLETELPLRLLSLLYLEPMGPAAPGGSEGRIAATVVRCGATGVGLEWCEFAAETTKAFARLAAASNDADEAHQLPLPEMADTPPASRAASQSRDLLGLCRMEFRG